MPISPWEPLPVLYRDDWIVVVHKPAGLLVHRSAVDAHETRFALQLLRRQLRRRAYPVHRLDKGTSGALLFALDAGAAATLAAAQRRHELQRTYLAVVRGRVEAACVIDRPLGRRRDPAEAPRAGGRGPAAPEATALLPAITRCRPLATVELPHRVDRYPTARYSLLQLDPASGRRHQLRRHLSGASHPIIGDTTYGNGRHNRLFRRLFGSRRLLLACVELRMPHPITHEPLAVTAPLAADLGTVIDALGWSESVPARWRPGTPARPAGG